MWGVPENVEFKKVWYIWAIGVSQKKAFTPFKWLFLLQETGGFTNGFRGTLFSKKRTCSTLTWDSGVRARDETQGTVQRKLHESGGLQT